MAKSTFFLLVAGLLSALPAAVAAESQTITSAPYPVATIWMPGGSINEATDRDRPTHEDEPEDEPEDSRLSASLIDIKNARTTAAICVDEIDSGRSSGECIYMTATVASDMISMNSKGGDGNGATGSVDQSCTIDAPKSAVCHVQIHMTGDGETRNDDTTIKVSVSQMEITITAGQEKLETGTAAETASATDSGSAATTSTADASADASGDASGGASTETSSNSVPRATGAPDWNWAVIGGGAIAGIAMAL